MFEGEHVREISLIMQCIMTNERLEIKGLTARCMVLLSGLCFKAHPVFFCTLYVCKQYIYI